MNKNPICFYHNDLDGKCSAAIVRKVIDHIELYEITYGDEFPWEKIQGREIIMVDFSLPIDDMIRLKNESKSLIWIDHHKTAIEEVKDIIYKQGIKGSLNINYAACELTWNYFFQKRPMPKAVTLLGRYDVWDHTNKDTVPFQYGMRLHNWHPCDSVWNTVLGTNKKHEEVIYSIVLNGELVLKYEKRQNEIYAKNSYEMEFEGLRALVCNHGPAGSALFESVYNPEKHDIMIAFHQLKDGRWKYSLRSEKPEIDCGKIAKKYGGGGHPGAAGFTLSDSGYHPFYQFQP